MPNVVVMPGSDKPKPKFQKADFSFNKGKSLRHWNLPGDPVITSKRQLAAECEKRGLICRGLDSDAHERRARERAAELEAKGEY